jgi:hypothetical protein
MYLYPWDAWDEGTDAVVERLLACGIDAVQLAVCYHIATYLLPRNPRRVVYFGDHGALYFRPSDELVRSAGVAAPVSDSLRDGLSLTEVLDGLERAGLARIAWLVYAYDHALARARPDLAVRNVFGDHSQAQLCTVNPVFARYAVALTEEVLERFGFDGLVAESLCALRYDYGFLNPKLGVSPSPAAAFILGVCWCDACRSIGEGAGLDTARLGDGVQRWLRTHLNALPDDDLGRMPVAEVLGEPFGDDLGAYRAAQVARTTRLHREVLELASRRRLSVGSTTLERSLPTIDSCVSVEALAPLVDDARIPLEPSVATASIVARLQELRERLPSVGDVHGLVQLEQFDSREAFGRVIDAASSAGIRCFRFYNYGLLSETQLGWLSEGKGAWS